MSDLLRWRSVATPAMIATFDDGATIAHALAFEAALARAQGAAGVIAPAVAEAIADGLAQLRIDPAELAEEAALAGTLAIPLVARACAALDGEAARALHRAATSQDLADSVLMMQVRRAGVLLLRDLDRLLAEETGLPVLVAEEPLTCVVRGCGMALERMDRLGSIFTSE